MMQDTIDREDEMVPLRTFAWLVVALTVSAPTSEDLSSTHSGMGRRGSSGAGQRPVFIRRAAPRRTNRA